MTNKPTKRPINGVLLLDKPEGLSSNTALQKRGVCSVPKKPGIPAYSILWPQGFCLFVSEKRPSSPNI